MRSAGPASLTVCMSKVMDEKHPQNPDPANDPKQPNPGDPGPAMPEQRRWVDPFEDDRIPEQHSRR
jgi:hypothetical protein